MKKVLMLAMVATALTMAQGRGGRDTAWKPGPLSDRPERIRILPLDTVRSDTAGPIRIIPLPEGRRLRESLLHPDSIRSRVEGDTFRLRPGDLVPGTGEDLAGKASREFRAYWKRVEQASGFPELRRQIRAGTTFEKSWVPKMLFYDSAVVVIPGYVFLRFP